MLAAEIDRAILQSILESTKIDSPLDVMSSLFGYDISIGGIKIGLDATVSFGKLEAYDRVTSSLLTGLENRYGKWAEDYSSKPLSVFSSAYSFAETMNSIKGTIETSVKNFNSYADKIRSWNDYADSLSNTGRGGYGGTDTSGPAGGRDSFGRDPDTGRSSGPHGGI